MTTMMHPAARLPNSQHHPLRTAILVVVFWIVAAVLVVAAHLEIEPWSPRGGAAVTIAALLLVACAYTRLVAREAGITHALGVGIAWLVLSIAAEVALTTQVGHGWFTLLGPPDRPLLRTLLLFVWIFSPALFARRGVSSGRVPRTALFVLLLLSVPQAIGLSSRWASFTNCSIGARDSTW